MYKKYILILFLPLLFIGCSKITADNSFDVTIKSLSLSKVMAEEIAETVIEMHNNGLISDDDYNKIKNVYNQAANYAKLVILSVETAIELGYLPHEYSGYLISIEAYQKAIDELINLVNKYNILKQRAY